MFRKELIFVDIINSYLIDSPSPSNLSYWWNFGSLLATCLIVQLITGVTLAMHYTPNIELAFSSVEHIMRDVNNGWIIRYAHANTASLFFIFIYLHIGKAMYYGSYRHPRILLWSIGVVILILLMGIGFLGYVLPWGSMSYWGATVITNLLSAIHMDIVEYIWGSFSVGNPTLNRFYSLHYLLPFVLTGLIVLHVIALHQHGSNNPMGVTGNFDRISFHPYYTFKDLVGFNWLFLFLSFLIFYAPNYLGHPDNYIPANPLVTPAHIQPEWYLLPYYAILRSIPSKLGGVVAMFSSLLILFILPFTDRSNIRSCSFRPFMRVLFWIFVLNFIILLWIGAEPVEEPLVEVGKYSTLLYFAHYLGLVPLVSVLENTVAD